MTGATQLSGSDTLPWSDRTAGFVEPFAGYESTYSAVSQRQPTAELKATSPLSEAVSSTTQTAERPRLGSSVEGRQATNAESFHSRNRTAAQNSPSPAFRRMRMNQGFREIADNMADFRRSLGTTESAVWMTQFRSGLESLWKHVPPEDVHRSRAIAAIQSAIRFQKWRNIDAQGAAMLARAVELTSARQFGEEDAKRLYSVLYSGSADVFPSANANVYSDNTPNGVEEE